MRDERIRTFLVFLFPLRKKMRVIRFITAISIISVLFSCGLEEVGERPNEGGGNIWTGPGMNAGSGDSTRTVCYVTALEYPDDYDWRADPEKGSVKCSLVVYADDLPMMKIPVGDKYEVSSDPDMHRILSGHLYTDYSTDTETVIKKDGRELFRFPGREMVVGMIVDGGDLYTLGQPRSGTGFRFRKNGEVIIERTQGRAFGRMYLEEGSVCFAFCEQIVSSDKTYERYYHVMGDEVSQVALREDVKKVWDIIYAEGKICFIASVTGVDEPVLFKGEAMSAIDMPRSSEMVTCRFVSYDDEICIEGIYLSDNQLPSSGIWLDGGLYHQFPAGSMVSSICICDGGVCCVVNGVQAISRGMIFRCGETFPISEGYMAMGSDPIRIVDGILNVGLSSINGECPMIWRDGMMKKMDMNGFISTISTNKD